MDRERETERHSDDATAHVPSGFDRLKRRMCGSVSKQINHNSI